MAAGVSPYAGTADRPIFIGACPRSGTTLLRSMLNTHPEIAIPRETRFLTQVWDDRMKWRDLSDRKRRRALARLIADGTTTTRARRLETPRREVVERLVEAPPTLGSLLGTCFILYAESTGKQRWGDKRPLYARYLDAVFSLFPDAQYINVIRDPRASIASMRVLGWFDHRFEPALDVWQRSIRAVEPWRDVLSGDQYLDVRYEDLVSDPDQALGRIALFLGLSTESIPAMLSYHEHVDELSQKLHPHLHQPVSTESVRAWENVLRPDEVALVEQVAGRRMQQFDYQPVASARRVPRTLRSGYQLRRARELLQRPLLEAEELHRLMRCRQPVAARLTSGQQQIEPTAAQPPFLRRHIGKPR